MRHRNLTDDRQHLAPCLVRLTDAEIQTVSGARWREERAAPPLPPPDNTVAAMSNAWGISDPGGIGTGPGVYGECYSSPTCPC
jgi:hypothetical protein